MARIVVGVDGSEGAAVALRWAVAEGRARQAPVVAVMAWGYLDQRHAVQDAAFDPTYGEPEARAALDAALTAALGDDAADVERVVICDLAPKALLETAEGDDLLVVGARGLGGFKGLLLGSVSQKVLSGAKVPVAVVRPEPGGDPAGPIVVGVDASQTARVALDWALDEARARGREVRVVHGWTAPFVGGYPFGAATFDQGLIEEGAKELLAQVVAGADTSDVTVHQVTAYGTGASVLLEEAPTASLVVVGSRGLGGFTRWLLGSVSHQVVQHAPGTVVVVPAPSDD